MFPDDKETIKEKIRKEKVEKDRKNFLIVSFEISGSQRISFTDDKI